jgi:hypothetical protein
MIIVCGHKNYVSLSGDQARLAQIVQPPAPCLNQYCRSCQACRIYTVQRFCTIYSCIPLCRQGPAQEVVKCEVCGCLWTLDRYIAILQDNARMVAELGRTTRLGVGGRRQTGCTVVVKHEEQIPLAFSCCAPCDSETDGLVNQSEALPIVAQETFTRTIDLNAD